MWGPQILYTCEGPQNPRPPHPARDLNRLSQTQVQRSAQKAHTHRHAHTCTLTRSDMRPTEIHTHTGKGAKAHRDSQTETQMCSQEPAGPPMPGGPCNIHLPTHMPTRAHTPQDRPLGSPIRQVSPTVILGMRALPWLPYPGFHKSQLDRLPPHSFPSSPLPSSFPPSLPPSLSH